MERNEILLEKYRLIAEFVGATVLQYRTFYTVEFPDKEPIWDTDLKYLDSWDDLIDVLKYIKEKTAVELNIITYNFEKEKTFDEIINFIKWYKQ